LGEEGRGSLITLLLLRTGGGKKVSKNIPGGEEKGTLETKPISTPPKLKGGKQAKSTSQWGKAKTDSVISYGFVKKG